MATGASGRLKLLDLFCKAGGAGMGYYRAGFDVTGIDIEPQPRYPFRFVQADALEYLAEHWREYDVIHASPPCQAYTSLRNIAKKKYPNLIPPTRELLKKTGLPYVIENVAGSPLNGTLLLCGTMFGLRTIRHRFFETEPVIWIPPIACNHNGYCAGQSLKDKTGKRIIQSFEHVDFISVAGNSYKASDGRIALGIDWMTQNELDQAIPPAYTEWIGRRLLEMLGA